ncbi:hypothetical protein RFN58_35470 [Streptomyces iakyrus]|uniref:hypothetical protein n=1 Tax=Streptomyces iakyrus TaxID=68219 RepID=UPI00068F623D|nr:hypothetical protein [Streptomyces iakyrus]
MGSRRQHTPREAHWTTRIAALGPALAVLLAGLVICLGFVAHSERGPATTSMTSMSATTAPAGTPAGHHATTAAHPSDCPYDDVCCRSATDDVGAVPASTAQLLPAVLPRVPDLPRQPDTPSRPTDPASACRAPDLHVLQVQRT